MTKRRYILIEQNSGLVCGDTEAVTPIEACIAIDRDVGTESSGYTEHGPRSSAARSHTGGYFVYEAPEGFRHRVLADDYREVGALPCVAFVETHRALDL